MVPCAHQWPGSRPTGQTAVSLFTGLPVKEIQHLKNYGQHKPRRYRIGPSVFTMPPAQAFLSGSAAKIKLMGNIPGTLDFDTLSEDLKAISEYFHSITATDLITTEQDFSQNATLLNELKEIVYS